MRIVPDDYMFIEVKEVLLSVRFQIGTFTLQLQRQTNFDRKRFLTF